MPKLLSSEGETPSVYLLVGEGGVYRKPTVVRTVLGSCVSVTLYCQRLRLGGVFHALLPQWREHQDSENVYNPYKFVDSAVFRLVDDLARLGARRDTIQAKIFGGANNIEGGLNIGKRNVLAAFQTLEHLHIRVIASSVGGTAGRKLVFHTDTGDVYVKVLRESQLKKKG